VSETTLLGGDMNVVVRVGDTVRRPIARWSDAVHALLRHFEAIGFDGAPRFIGVDEKGREILSYVEGEAALAPAPSGEDVLFDLGALVRRMHDAQDGFVDPGGWIEPTEGAVVCFHDFFPPNVIFRDEQPVALIDWDLARRGEPADDVAMAASWWAPLQTDLRAERWGFPLDRRGERLRRLCDGYGLEERSDLIDRLVALRSRRLEADAERAQRARLDIQWLEDHRAELESWL
jgi:Ser/Thr protein kinase RdoA (MazF antagonist)